MPHPIKQPQTRVTPRQAAKILLRVDSYEIPGELIVSLTRKIQDACNRYRSGIRDAKALKCSSWEVGNSCRHSITLENLFNWYATISDPVALRQAVNA